MRRLVGGVVAVVVLLVVVGGLAGTAAAEPTEIGNWTELQDIEADLDGEYVLTNDLGPDTPDYDEIASETANDGAGFVPIGTPENTFNGTFDGNGHTIDGLFINRTDEEATVRSTATGPDQVGLFGATNDSEITNVALTNAFVRGENDVGTVVGAMEGGSITDVTVTDAYVRATFAQRGGGLVGQLSNGTVDSSYTDGEVHGSGDIIGGLVGEAIDSTIENSESSATVAGGTDLGGAVGILSGGEVVNTHAHGNVSGEFEGKSGERAGGLVGWNDGGTIADSTANGQVSGVVWVGGLIGWNGEESEQEEPLLGLVEAPSVSNATATGDVTGMDSVGGLIGQNAGNIADVTANGDVMGLEVVGGLIGQNAGGIANATANGDVSGATVLGGLIGENGGGVAIASSVEEASVTDTSSLADLTDETTTDGFTVQISEEEITEGDVSASTATGNVTVLDEGQSFGLVGGLIGTNGGGNVTHSTAEGHVTVAQQGDLVGLVGGLIGTNGDGNITHSTAAGDVTLASEGGNLAGAVGGLVGFSDQSNVSQSMAHGNVTVTGDDIDVADLFAGGLLGGSQDGNVIESTAAGDITVSVTANNSGAAAGGLVGQSWNTNVSQSTAAGDVVVEIISTAAEEYTFGGGGGLVGITESSTVNNSNATGEVTVTVDGEGEIDGVGGGLAGVADSSTVTESSAAGNVVVSAPNATIEAAGGLVGAFITFDGIGELSASEASGDVLGDANVGGLVGANGFTAEDGPEEIAGVDIRHATASGTTAVLTDDGWNVGGLVGQNINATVERANATGDVVAPGATNVGGLVGYTNATMTDETAETISESYATGSVTGNESVGGLVGLNVDDTITNSYATGAVTGNEGVGGLVGTNSGENATVNQAYAAGLVDSDGNAVGGLVGANVDNATVEDAYWDTETTGQNDSAGNPTGLTTDEMKGEDAPDNMPAFDFDMTWDVLNERQDGTVTVSYPFLVDNTQEPAPGLDVTTLVSFADQGIDAGTITVTEANSLGGEAALIVTYEQGGELTIAGLATGTFENESVSIELEDFTGFAGEFTAHIITAEDLSAEYAVGDTVSEQTASAILTQQEAFVSVEVSGNLARDTTGDGLLNDLTGDGEFTIADVQALFMNLDNPVVQEYAWLFDFAGLGNDRVSVFDIQALFTQLQAESVE